MSLELESAEVLCERARRSCVEARELALQAKDIIASATACAEALQRRIEADRERPAIARRYKSD